MENLTLLGYLIIGTVMLVVGLRIRMGGMRRWVLLYRDYRHPWYIRNGAFIILPASGILILAPIAKYAMERTDDPFAFAIALLLAPVLASLFFVGVLWAYRPPDIAKPEWLRAEEIQHGEPEDPSPRLARFEKLAVLLIFAPLALALAVVILGGVRWLLLAP